MLLMTYFTLDLNVVGSVVAYWSALSPVSRKDAGPNSRIGCVLTCQPNDLSGICERLELDLNRKLFEWVGTAERFFFYIYILKSSVTGTNVYSI